jgi:hypothetical protein
MKTHSIAFSILAIIWILFSQIGFAQATGSLQGTVTDPSGAVVPGAKVVVRQAGSEFIKTVQTNAEGRYVLLTLPPGTYHVEVSTSGFKDSVFDNIVVGASQTSMNVQLSICTAIRPLSATAL